MFKPPSDRSEDMPEVWRALASPVRRAILDGLREGPQTTGAIAASFSKLSRFAIMQHLAVLVEADLVIPRRVSRERYNYLNPAPILRCYDRWISRYAKPWTEALVNLRNELEADEGKEIA